MPITETETKHHAARLNFRLPPNLKETVERAALASGLTVTDFAINSLVNSANAVLERQQTRVLSDRACDAFMKLLDEQEPNEALRKAAEKYKQHIQSV